MCETDDEHICFCYINSQDPEQLPTLFGGQKDLLVHILSV